LRFWLLVVLMAIISLPMGNAPGWSVNPLLPGKCQYVTINGQLIGWPLNALVWDADTGTILYASQLPGSYFVPSGTLALIRAAKFININVGYMAPGRAADILVVSARRVPCPGLYIKPSWQV
jgi:hypothetical protein